MTRCSNTLFCPQINTVSSEQRMLHCKSLQCPLKTIKTLTGQMEIMEIRLFHADGRFDHLSQYILK